MDYCYPVGSAPSTRQLLGIFISFASSNVTDPRKVGDVFLCKLASTIVDLVITLTLLHYNVTLTLAKLTLLS